MMNGNVNRMRSGLKMAFRKLRSTTAQKSAPIPLQWIPGTSWVAMSTPTARISQRTRSCRKGEFIRSATLPL
jgi:hypothetical protein